MLNFGAQLIQAVDSACAKQQELQIEAAAGRKRHSSDLDISLIIPCTCWTEDEATALHFTVVSALSELQNSGLNFEIIVVIDGDGDKIPERTILLRDCGIVDAMIQTKCGSAQGSRQCGARRAKGEFLIFADGHCSFPFAFFETLIGDMKATGADLMHAPFRALNLRYYNYRVDWDGYLWNAMHVTDPVTAEPYRVAQAGHGCFAARRDSFFRVGGYWQALKGFGGEETQLNFKFWLAGMSCWTTPRVFHWHQFNHIKAVKRNFVSPDSPFVRNFLMISAAYGGKAQVIKACAGLSSFLCAHIAGDIVNEVLADSAVCEERQWIADNAKFKSIYELREMFEREGVLN